MRICLLNILIFFAAGCGSDQLPTYKVSGQVVFDNGRPVRHGIIEFTSVQHGTTASSRIQHDGSFTLGTYSTDDGAVAGDHDVIVVQMVIADGSFKHTKDHGSPVPTKYASYETSSLTGKVEPINGNVLSISVSQKK